MGDYGLLGGGYFGDLANQQLQNAMNQAAAQNSYLQQGWATASSTPSTTFQGVIGYQSSAPAPARPRTNLEWLDEDIRRYRTKLAA